MLEDEIAVLDDLECGDQDAAEDSVGEDGLLHAAGSAWELATRRVAATAQYGHCLPRPRRLPVNGGTTPAALARIGAISILEHPREEMPMHNALTFLLTLPLLAFAPTHRSARPEVRPIVPNDTRTTAGT